MKKLPLFLILSCFASLVSATEQNKKIYTWTDEHGTIHFSDAPVQGNDAEVLSQGEYNVAALAPKVSQWQQNYQKNKESKAEEKKRLEADNQEKNRYCKQIKKRLAIFSHGGRIYNASENGERSFYSDEAIAKEIKQLNSKLKKNCA